MTSPVPAVDPADFTDEAIAKLAPVCNECGTDTERRVVLVRGSAVYARRADLHDLWFWRCSCGAYCGTHIGTLKSKGTPAGFATREARKRAHAAFDPLWKRKATEAGIKLPHARAKGYKWLAAQLEIEPAKCLIGEMTEHDADRVTALCSRYRR